VWLENDRWLLHLSRGYWSGLRLLENAYPRAQSPGVTSDHNPNIKMGNLDKCPQLQETQEFLPLYGLTSGRSLLFWMRLPAKLLQSSHFDNSCIGSGIVDYADCGRAICEVEAAF
jgi:hypothetical protein